MMIDKMIIDKKMIYWGKFIILSNRQNDDRQNADRQNVEMPVPTTVSCRLTFCRP